MKQFKVFVRKEFYHILRDKWTMIILLCLPVVMLILFGYAISTEVKNTKVGVYYSTQDMAVMSIINKLQANEYFIIDKIFSNTNQINNSFKKNEIGLAVIFSNNFYENILHSGDAQIQLIADGTDPNTATILTNYATNIINSYKAELLNINSLPYQIKPEIKLLYNPSMKSAYNFVPGVMGMILILICAMMTSVSIAREKETGTMEVLLVSPVKPIMIIIAKTVPYFVISCFNLITVLLISSLIMGVPIAGSLALLIFISLLYIFLALSLGLLISTIVDTQIVALLISGMALMIPIILLSGMMFPVENMPAILRMISEIIPAKWFIIAIKKIMIKGLEFEAVVNEIIILTAMTIIILTISLKKFKTRLE